MNSNFKISRAGYYISKNVFAKSKTPLRTVKLYEIELYTAAGNTSMVNGISHIQKSGNILVARPGDKRCSIGSFECFCVHFLCFDPEICDALDKLPTVFTPSDTESLKRIFKSISEAQSMSGLSRTLFIQGNMTELIGILLSENTDMRSTRYDRYRPSVFSACSYMENYCDRHITLADIAAAANLSPGFFHKVFKTLKGMTPAEYLANLRINRAKALLSESDLPPAEIAVACGFGSQSYFNYVFKKETTLTPKGYRDNKRIII